MLLKISMPGQFQFRMIQDWKSVFFHRGGDIHYIGGAEILPPPLELGEEAACIEKLGGEQNDIARNTLVEHNLRLVVYIAKKFDNTGVGVEDLISIGTIGLMKAINTFNPTKNIKLATYASRCIENEILMYFRSRKKLQGEVSLSDSIETDQDGNDLMLMDVVGVDDTMLSDLQDREDSVLVRRLVRECLTDREREIVTLRYGLGGRMPRTQREIAKKLGISRSYVSRIEKRALEKLEEAIGERG